MTNAMIIMVESVRLMEEGVIKPTGRKLKADINGEVKEFDEPEALHTYQKWSSLGFQVKKGEKAVAQFPIWKMCKPSKKQQEEAEKNGETAKGKMIMKTASFFTASQVERFEKIL